MIDREPDIDQAYAELLQVGWAMLRLLPIAPKQLSCVSPMAIDSALAARPNLPDQLEM